jgi:hypothetical protein
VDIHPPLARYLQFDPDGQPVGLRRVAQLAKCRQAGAESVCVDGKVKIAMQVGLPAGQGGPRPSLRPPSAAPSPRAAR